jgi:hypothetical protein
MPLASGNYFSNYIIIIISSSSSNSNVIAVRGG